MKSRTLSVVLLLMAIIATGFLRDFIILNVNQQLAFRLYDNEEYQLHRWISFLRPLSYWGTYALKWVFVATFFLLYGLLTHLGLKAVNKRDEGKLVLVCYLFLGIASMLIFGAFGLFGAWQKGYEVARYPLIWAQSPIPLMILVPALYLKRASSVNA